jgi:hypothetical protein
MTVDDFGKDVGQIAGWVDVVELTGSIREVMVAQCSAPPSNPANNAFFRLSAIGRMERSTVLLSSSMRPSSMSASGLPNATRCNGWLREFALLTDQTKFCPQPRFKGIDDLPTFLLPNRATFVGAAAADGRARDGAVTVLGNRDFSPEGSSRKLDGASPSRVVLHWHDGSAPPFVPV